MSAPQTPSSGPFTEKDLKELTQMAGPAYAGFWIRVAATLIDAVAFMLVALPLTFLFYGWEAVVESESLILGPADVLINYLLPTVVTVWMWVKFGGTPGKLLLGLRVVDAQTGQPVKVGQGIGRYLGYFVSLLVLGLGFVWVGFDRKKQGLHDKLISTVVVHK